MARKPEENVEVFELGHYEAVQTTLALADAGHEELAKIFAHGNITVIRKVDEQ